MSFGKNSEFETSTCSFEEENAKQKVHFQIASIDTVSGRR